MEGIVRSFKGEELSPLQGREGQHGPFTGTSKLTHRLQPFPQPSFSTSKTKRAFHRGRGGVGSNDDEGELDEDEGRA